MVPMSRPSLWDRGLSPRWALPEVMEHTSELAHLQASPLGGCMGC